MWLTELGTEDESGYRVLIQVGILWLIEQVGIEGPQRHPNGHRVGEARSKVVIECSCIVGILWLTEQVGIKGPQRHPVWYRVGE